MGPTGVDVKVLVTPFMLCQTKAVDITLVKMMLTTTAVFCVFMSLSHVKQYLHFSINQEKDMQFYLYFSVNQEKGKEPLSFMS